MENQDLSKRNVVIVNFNKEEMKIYNFLVCLSTSCKDPVPFKNVGDAARLYNMDAMYVNIITNKHFLLAKGKDTTNWNPMNVIDARLVNSIYVTYLKDKKSKNDLRKLNKAEESKIPSNLVPVTKILNKFKADRPVRDPYGNIQETTVDKYLRFMQVIFLNKTIETSRLYATVREMKITAELKTTLESLGLIATINREVMWDDTVIPCRKLSTRVAQYMNAKIQKKELPPFNINDYRGTPTAVVSVPEVKHVVDVAKTEVIEERVTVLTKTEAKVEVGNSASINMLLAQEIIAKGGDKELALKLMRNEI